MSGPNDVSGKVEYTDGFSSVFAAAASVVRKATDDVKGTFETLKGRADELGTGLKTVFTDPIGGVQQLASSIGSDLKGALSAIGPEAAGAAGAIGGILAVGAAVVGIVGTLGNRAASSGEDVLAFSQRTGIAVENVGQLQFAVTAAGGSLDTVSGILQHLTLKEATDQSGRFAAALKDIGINSQTFANEDNESRLLDLAKGFQAGAKSGNDMGVAIALMGRSGAENIPMLMKLTDGLMATGAKLGVQWTKDSVEAAERFKVGLGTVETAIGGIATRIGLALLPALTDMVTGFAKSPTFIDDATSATVTLAHGLGYLVEGVGYTISTLIGMGAEMVRSGGFALALSITAEKMAMSILKALSYLPGATAEATVGFAALATRVHAQEDELKSLAGTHKDLQDASTGTQKATKAIGDALIGLTAQSMNQVEANLALNRTHNDNTAAAEAYAKAVQQIVDALEGDSKKTRETSAAIDQVIAAGTEDVDTKTRVLQAIEKLIAGNVALTQSQLDFYQQNIELSAAYKAGQESLIALDQKYAELVQKSTGQSLDAKLAADQREYDSAKKVLDGKTMLVVDYFAALAKLQAIKKAEDDAARLEQAQKDQKFADETAKIWGDYYAEIAKDDKDTFSASLQNIDTWYAQQVAALDLLLSSGAINWTQYFQRVVALQADATAKQIQAVNTYSATLQKRQQDDLDLEDQINKIRLERSGNTVAAQIADIQKWYDDLVTKHRVARDEDEQYYTDLATLAHEKIQDVIHANDPLWAAWKGLQTDMRSSMASTWEQVLSGAKSWKDAMLQPFTDFRTGLLKILAAILADWEQQLFNPLLKLAHNAMGTLMGMLTGGGAGGGGLLSGLFGQGAQLGGAAMFPGLFGGAAGAALPGAAVGGLAIPGAAGGASGGGFAGGLGGLFGGLSLGTLAVGGGIGAGGLGIGYLLSNAFGKTAGSVGGGLAGAGEGALIGSVVPGIGTAIGAVIGGLSGVVGGLFGGNNSGRKAVEDWVNETFGSFNKLHDSLNALSGDFQKAGVNSEDLWKKLTQDVGRGDKEGARAAIQFVIDAFKKLQAQQQATADTSAQASTEITKSFQEASDAMQETFAQPISIKYRYDVENAPPGGSGSPDFGGAQADGGNYYVDKPTWFLAGEKPGGEYVSFGGVGKGPIGGGGGSPIHITVISQLDGREVARNQVQYIPSELSLMGIGNGIR